MAAPSTQQRSALVAKELRIPFLLLLLCFAAWGTSANLTDVLVGVFRSIFTMTILESSPVQFTYLRSIFPVGHPGGDDQPEVRFQDRPADRPRAGGGGGFCSSRRPRPSPMRCS